MQKQLIHNAPIFVMGQQVDTNRTITYVAMTTQEIAGRRMLFALALFASMFISAAIASI